MDANSILILGYEIPDYVFYLIGIVIATGIYFSSDEEKQHKINIFLGDYGFLCAIPLLWLFFRNRLGYFDYGTFWTNRANLLAVLAFLSFGIYKFARYMQKYKSTHAICDNLSGSCAKYEFIEDFVVMSIESIDSGIFPTDKGRITWVGKKEHFNKINDEINSSKTQIILKTKLFPADLIELPSCVYDVMVASNIYNKDNILFGTKTPEDYKHPKKDKEGKIVPPYSDLMRIKDANRTANESRDISKMKLNSIKDFVQKANVITKKASGKSPKPLPENMPQQEY